MKIYNQLWEKYMCIEQMEVLLRDAAAVNHRFLAGHAKKDEPIDI